MGPSSIEALEVRATRLENLSFAGQLDESARLADDILAITYARGGQPDKAEPLYRETIEVGARTLGPLHPEQLAGVVNFASFLQRNERYEEAIEQASAAIDGFSQSTGDDFIGCGYARHARGASYRSLGHNAEAAEDFEECYRVFALIFGPDDQRALRAAAELAEIHDESGNTAAAARWRERM